MANFQRQNHCECFDFPCSWTFYRDHCRNTHGFDPGDNEAPPTVPPIEIPKAQIVYQFVTKPMPMPDRAKAAQKVRQVRENKPSEGIEL